MKVLRNKSVWKDSKSTLCCLNWSFPELRLKLLTRVAVNMFRKVSSCGTKNDDAIYDSYDIRYIPVNVIQSSLEDVLGHNYAER